MSERVAPPLQLAVAALTLVPGGMGGTETYTTELLRALAGRPTLDVTAYTSRGGGGLGLGVRTRAVAGVHGGAAPHQRLRTLAQAALHRRRLLSAWAGQDVVFYPVTVFAPWPAPGPRPAVVQTLHDVQHLDLPHLFGRVDRLYRRRWYEAAARRADHVITDSQFAKRSIVEHLGLDPERISVVPLGVDASAFVPNLGEREPFLLYPARGWAHKNHRRLVDAVALVRESRPDLRLVLTGGALGSLGSLPEWVEVRGLVARTELVQLYRRAACLVFPSLYEGFGIPPLEAMASGCPVAASNAGSVPEVCGDAAELFDPTDPEAIAAGVLRALGRADELTALGLAHAARFTWQACADGHEAVFRAVAGRA